MKAKTPEKIRIALKKHTRQTRDRYEFREKYSISVTLERTSISARSRWTCCVCATSKSVHKSPLSRAQPLNLTPSQIASNFCLLLTSTPPELGDDP